jgi:protein-S-isoprenylcysteine O-methyltransferase Ste14
VLGAGIAVSIGIWVVLALYVFSEIRDAYDRGRRFPKKLLPVWYGMWGLHHLPVAVASVAGVCPFPAGSIAAGFVGVVAIACGTTAGVLGMTRFGSYARSAGQDTSRLITTGIYRWSRNPQVVGWFLVLFGISVAGRSGLALLLTGLFAVVIHSYTIRLEEPYLERVYGEEYRRYRADTPRYLGVPGRIAGAA